MNFPDYRPRRMRRSENLRRMIRETRLEKNALVYPLFVVPGKGVKKVHPGENEDRGSKNMRKTSL